jgi:hypothetical protein
MNSDTLIQSTVQHGGKWFFASTINRESSAQLSYGGTYAETMVWEWNFDTKTRGDLVGQDEGSTDSIRVHIVICERLHSTGKFDADEGDESPSTEPLFT